MPVQSFGPFRLISSKRLLEKDGEPVVIGGRTLDLLIALVAHAGEVVSVRELIALIWPNVTVEEANLRVSISALRKLLGDGRDGARYIVNVPGRGYMFVAPVRSEGREGPAEEDSASSLARPRRVPEVPQLLVGRHDTVLYLSRLLLARRFVSVVGPGGIGKTTVALAVAHGLRSEFDDDQVCFVDGGAISDADDLPNAVASALGCPDRVSDPLPGICAFLAERRSLLILDSCEHVIEAAASLCEHLFQTLGRVHLLVTSREALRVDGENLHLLQPLPYPLDEAPTALQAMATPAVQLFVGKAAASGHPEALSDKDAPVVSTICRRLDGIALAIELVASRVGVYGIHGTMDLLDSGAELVLQGRRDASPRHQTLQALHDWSYRLLSAGEQKVLARLSVFVGELTLVAAHAVVGDTEDDRKAITQAIASLGDRSLIQVCSAQGPARYRLLDTTRAYAAHKLAERGEEDEMARRHARYFTSVLEQTRMQGPALGDPGLSQLTSSMGNIRRAMAWSFSPAGDRSIGLRLTEAMANLSPGHTLLRECHEWCQHALGIMQEAGRPMSLDFDLRDVLPMSFMHALGNGGEAATRRGLQLA